jgi:hypothetical protein
MPLRYLKNQVNIEPFEDEGVGEMKVWSFGPETSSNKLAQANEHDVISVLERCKNDAKYLEN